jgi:hypothetical protein
VSWHANALKRLELRLNQRDAHVEAWRRAQYLKQTRVELDARDAALRRETTRLLLALKVRTRS